MGVVGGAEKEAGGSCGGVCTGFKIDQKNKQNQVFSEKGRKVPTQAMSFNNSSLFPQPV